MAEFPALPFWTDAYLGDTAHLTNEEHGVYLRLLMFAWRSPDCCLPDDDRRLAIMVGVTDKKWRALRPVIAAFWTVADGTWTQKRLTRERDFVRGKSRKNSAAAKARWEGKPLENNDKADADAMPTHMPSACQTDAPTPTPTPIKKEEGKPSLKKRGSRLADDWLLPRSWGAWAVNEGLTEDQTRREADRFRDFWLSKPGAGGVKLEWEAVWRNWVRKKIDDIRKDQGNGKSSRGEKFLNSFIAGASIAPTMDFGEDSHPSRPLLARR